MSLTWSSCTIFADCQTARVSAYADNITVFVSHLLDIVVVKEAVVEYERMRHTPSAAPEYDNFLKPILFMARDSSSGFRQRHHTATRNTTEGVGEKEQANNMDLGQLQAQEGKFFDTLHSCASVNYRRRVFFAKFQLSYNSSWLVFPLCFLLLTVIDSGLLTHLDWSLLLSVLDCPSPSFFANCPLLVPFPAVPLASLGPAFPSPHPVSSEILSSGFCLVLRQNRQRNRLPSVPPT